MTQTLSVNLRGVSLITHNGQTADPRNRFSKAMKLISGKRKKTDADLDELARIEFLAGLYISDGQFVIPGHVLESCIVAGAKKSKRGTQAKAAVFVDNDGQLDFKGKPEGSVNEEILTKLFEGGEHHLTSGVKVGTAKVMRTRPHLKDWTVTAEITYEEDLLNRSELIDILNDAGRQVGLCDWRPKHGRFTVEVLN